MGTRIGRASYHVLLIFMRVLLLASTAATDSAGKSRKADRATSATLRWMIPTVTVLDYTPRAMAAHVESMAAHWTAVTAGTLTLVYARREERACGAVRARAGTIAICAAPAQTTPIGETYVQLQRGHIRSATIWYYGDGTETYRDWCLLHELGHAIGLFHQNDSTVSVMYPYALEATAPLPGDVAAVHALYASDSSMEKQGSSRKDRRHHG